MGSELAIVSVAYLETVFTQTCQDDPRRAAEMAYALAVLAAKSDRHDRAQHYGEEAIRLCGQTDKSTLEGAAALHTVIAGVGIPDLIHDQVIRNRLEVLGVTLQ